MRTKAELLATMQRLRACGGATEWVESSPHEDFSSLWNACECGDWLLWLAAHLLDRRLVVRAACLCAREALVHVPASELRPLRAIETAEAWTRGEATIKEVRDATFDAKRGDASFAAYAVAYAADTVDSPDAPEYTAAKTATYAAHAAASAAYAFAYAGDAHAAAHARTTSLRRSADLVRSVITAETFEVAR